jgi:PAS domain S-box-containing protein
MPLHLTLTTVKRNSNLTSVQDNSTSGFQQSDAHLKQAAMQAELLMLREEIAALKQEKADLEILLEATADHSDSVEAELHDAAIAALRQSEEWFRAIAEATPVPVFISRIEDGAILYANTATSTTFGSPVEALLEKKTIEFYLDPNDRLKLLERIQREGVIQNLEVQCKRADGSVFWVSASLRQLTFSDQPTLLTALHDITQRKLEEEALKRQVRAMQIEIDQAKRARQVAEITQTDYFQTLQAEVEHLRYQED